MLAPVLLVGLRRALRPRTARDVRVGRCIVVPPTDTATRRRVTVLADGDLAIAGRRRGSVEVFSPAIVIHEGELVCDVALRAASKLPPTSPPPIGSVGMLGPCAGMANPRGARGAREVAA